MLAENTQPAKSERPQILPFEVSDKIKQEVSKEFFDRITEQDSALDKDSVPERAD